MTARKARRGGGRASKRYVGGVGSTALPVGNLTGWTQVVAEDFNTPVTIGGWAASAIASRFFAYDGFTDTAQNGLYDPATVLSVSNSNLDFYLHTDGTQAKVGTVVIPNPTSTWDQLYGRFSMRMKSDALPKYKMAPLLWPGNDQWTNEIDFPEAHDLATFPAATANIYYDPALTFAGTWQNFSTSTDISDGQFHVYTIDWTPTQLRFYIDGTQVAATTTGVPQVPMRWTLQIETFISGGPRPDPANKPAPGTNGHVLIDWVAMYEYAP